MVHGDRLHHEGEKAEHATLDQGVGCFAKIYVPVRDAPGPAAASPEAGMRLEDAEHNLLVNALQKTGYNVTQAARLLGITRDTLRYRIEKHGLAPPGGSWWPFRFVSGSCATLPRLHTPVSGLSRRPLDRSAQCPPATTRRGGDASMSYPAQKAIVLPACMLAALTASSGAAAAPPLMTDQLLASQCAQCHGTYGRPVRDIEGLAGKSYGSLYSDMIEMRTEGPPSEIMEHQALGYSEDQIRRIALYYSSLPERAPTSSSYSSSTTTSSPTTTTTTTSSSGDSKRRRSSRYND